MVDVVLGCNSGCRDVGAQHKDRRDTGSLGEQSKITNREGLI